MAVSAVASKRQKKRRRKATACAKPKRRRSAKKSSEDPRLAFDSRRRRRKACAKKKKRKVKKKKPVAKRPPAVTKPVPRQPVPAPPKPPAAPGLTSPVAIYSGAFGRRQAERLLWRAGCGPSPGHADALAAMGLQGAVRSLTRPAGPAVLTGAEPTDGETPLQPEDLWGHDHLWFLDRMVRTNQPLMERMTLIWHDWFATSIEGSDQRSMIAQNQMFRRNALGSFQQMLLDVTADPAMLMWLDGVSNTKDNPNENYAREVMELFTLGADRGAYTEDDVRELARCLTGFDYDWSPELGAYNFRFVAARHDTGQKTVFGQSGNYDWQDAMRLCLNNAKHASFVVQKMWGYFIPVAPSAADSAALERAYVQGGFAIRPLVEAILMHPSFHTGPRMVKPPAIYVAGMLRQQRRAIDTGAWVWLGEGAGQRLFYPPNVAGWDDERWLDTSTVRARWETAGYVINGRELKDAAMDNYDMTETPEAALIAARQFWGDPELTVDGAAALARFSSGCLPAVMATWQKHTYRAIRQNALRHLIATSPDLQTC